jgi:hypothetical protein
MMKFLARMLGCVATAMALCAVLFSFGRIWFGEEGSALRLAGLLVFEVRRSEALQYRVEASNHSWEAKARIIRALRGGRLRLREAIDQFRRVNKELNEDLATADVDPGTVPAWVPLPTDPEGVGQLLLMWIRRDVAAWEPDKAKRLLADLESQFRELFGRAPPRDPWTDTELTRPDVDWASEPHREPQ